MAVELFSCDKCDWFGTSRAQVLNKESKDMYDYTCPVCGSKNVHVEAQDHGDYYSEIDTTSWGEE